MKTIVENKYANLLGRLKELRSVVVGFSGGIDSSFLLKASVEALGTEKVWGVTGDSKSLMPEELELCRKLITAIGLKPENFIEIETDELSDPNYSSNPIDRCFFCKSELFNRLQGIAGKVGAEFVLDGSNADDTGDWRPGRKAAEQLNVVSPLAEVGITKNDIREIARELGLPNWEKPSLACLASRIPYGSEITVDKLSQVAEAERYLKKLGFSQMRVRHHGETARIELLKSEMRRLFENELLDKVSDKLKSLGFTYITVDLQGYRSGSMNENINKDKSNE